MTETILIIGSIALDTIENIRGKREDLIGGSTTYVTVAAGRSVPVNVVGVIGNDFPDEGLEIYQRYANSLVDLECKEGNTFRWGGRYGENMDSRETLFTDLGVFSDFSPRLSTVNKNVSNVFLANIHPSLQLSVINQMAGKPLIVTDTMNLWIDISLKQLINVISRVNMFLLNDEEALLLTKKQTVEDAAEILLDMGPEIIIIKQGSMGSYLFDKKNNLKKHIPAFPVDNVVDTTGAGDSFAGGFVGNIEKTDIVSAIIAGSAIASFTVSSFGVNGLIDITKKEMNNRINYIKKIIKD